MRAVSGRCDVLVTVDANLPFQQNVSLLPFAIVVLRAKSNKVEDLRPLVPALVAQLGSAKPGHAYVISAP